LTTEGEERHPEAPPAGLCDTCAFQQLVHTTRGSVFSLCRRSRTEPDRYPRYPRLPVTECDGWERSAGPSSPSITRRPIG
jgi:hypothetical protein